MELLPTLRAQLDVLEPYLDDPSVREILLAGPDRVFVTRAERSERIEVELTERRLRALADRLLRALGGRPDRHEVRNGRLSDALEVTVIGTPRGARCPVVRVHRRDSAATPLSELAQAGLLSSEIEAQLGQLVAARRTVVVASPFGAPRGRLLAALATAWRADGRVLALDRPEGALSAPGVADLLFAPDTPIEGLLAAAPDVIVAEDPEAGLWTGLLASGRPALLAIEAPDGPTALERLVALALAGDARLSRPAAESLVLSTVASVIELAPGPRLWLRRIFGLQLEAGRVALTLAAEQGAPALEAALRAPSEPTVEPPDASSPFDAPADDVGPEDTSAFAAAALVEELSNEIAEAEAALRAESEPEPAADEAPPSAEAREDSEAQGPLLEEQTRFATDVQAAARARSARAQQDPDTAELPPRRVAAERMATVTGPPQPREVANQVAHVLDEIDLDPSEATNTGTLEALEEELRTSHAVAPPDLDPFETHEGQLEPHPMDSTQAAEISEMLSGEVNDDPRVLSIPSPATVAKIPPPPADDEWDEDAPSEIIDRSQVAGASEEAPGPFEDEKTPVAPLFDKSPRGGRRSRRRPRSAAEEAKAEVRAGTGRPAPAEPKPSAAPKAESGRAAKAAEGIGDPTRRRKDTPERPRGGRRRQRDRS